MRRFAMLAAAALLVGCATPHQIVDREDFLAEANRTYPGESRERVIGAAETILKTSDPQDWEFRYTLNGFTGLRRYVVYAVLATAQGREKWEFETEPQPEGLRASLSISDAGVASGGLVPTPYEGKMASLALYRLFWARMDYMLGRRPDWTSCAQAQAELRKTRTNQDALGGLCGPTSNGRNAPAPAPLPPASGDAPPAAVGPLAAGPPGPG